MIEYQVVHTHAVLTGQKVEKGNFILFYFFWEKMGTQYGHNFLAQTMWYKE